MSSWYPTRNHPFVGNFVKRQAQLFAQTHQITVLHTQSDPKIDSEEVEIHSEGNYREIIVYHPKGKNLLQKYILQRKAFKRGFSEIKQVDLVQAYILLPKGLQFIAAKKHFSCPLMVTEQGSYFRPEAKKERTWKDKLILRKIKKHISKLTAASPFLIKDLQSDFPAHSIGILPNHVDIDAFHPIDKEERINKKFLHVSTLDERLKNPQGIIDACAILVKNGTTNFELTIISDECKDKWIAYAQEKNVSHQIQFKGPFEWLQLVRFYQETDAFILFSVYETFSIVLAEAWACGVPTLTTSVGIGHQLPAELGMQIEINQPETLALAMLEIIDNKKQYDSNRIRSYAEPFSARNVTAIFDRYISNLLN